MISPIEQIYEFNQKAGLLDKPYNDFLESSFQIEEALEGISCSCQGGGLPSLAAMLNESVSYSIPIEPTHKSVARGIVEAAYYKNASDVERLDKACDAIVFAFGSMFKLGLTPHKAMKALSLVMDANMAKLSMPKDSHGKLMKPPGFMGPEERLAELLEGI